MKWPKFRRILEREPLNYRTERQTGSHAKMVSDSGYPTLRLAFHNRQELPGGLIRRILTRDVGLEPDKARDLLR